MRAIISPPGPAAAAQLQVIGWVCVGTPSQCLGTAPLLQLQTWVHRQYCHRHTQPAGAFAEAAVADGREWVIADHEGKGRRTSPAMACRDFVVFARTRGVRLVTEALRLGGFAMAAKRCALKAHEQRHGEHNQPSYAHHTSHTAPLDVCFPQRSQPSFQWNQKRRGLCERFPGCLARAGRSDLMP